MQRIIRSVLFGDVRHVVVPEAHDYVTFVRCLVCEDFDLIEDAPLPVCMVSSLVNIHGRLFVIDDQRTRLDLPIAIELSKELARCHDVTDVLVASLELIRENTKQLSAPFFLSFRYSFWQVHASKPHVDHHVIACCRIAHIKLRKHAIGWRRCIKRANEMRELAFNHDAGRPSIPAGNFGGFCLGRSQSEGVVELT